MAVTGFLSSGAATSPSTPATDGARANAGLRIAATLAAGHASDGGQTDRSCVDDDRTLVLSRSASFPGGSSPCLRPAHHIDSKGLSSGIDRRRIPHKMLETPASHKEEPDAWIVRVSKPGLHYQNSG